MRAVCKVLRNFTVPILRKMEITIDFNGPGGQLHHLITQKHGTVNLFQTSPSCSLDHCGQFALSFISFGHVCTATLNFIT